MRARWLAASALLAVLLGAACGSDERREDSAAPDAVSSEATATTRPLSFEGDPDSDFCRRSRDAADEPVLDPFAAGLEPREVELRFRALAQRFDGFADIAPEPLSEDLARLDETFQELATLLEAADYDFAELATEDIDVSIFDDPALAAVADRLAAYQDQVCGIG